RAHAGGGRALPGIRLRVERRVPGPRPQVGSGVVRAERDPSPLVDLHGRPVLAGGAAGAPTPVLREGRTWHWIFRSCTTGLWPGRAGTSTAYAATNGSCPRPTRTGM